MPEYPDITIYIERLEALVIGQPLAQIRLASPFFLRTADPPIKTIHGAVVRGVERMRFFTAPACPPYCSPTN